MNMHKVLVPAGALRAEPRGARWVGQLAAAALSLFDRARDAVASAAATSRQHAADVREARSRAAVITLALRYQGSQPSFAKDLFAAAARDD